MKMSQNEKLTYSLFVDESGNTGGVDANAKGYNFSEQPTYCLAGILLSKEQENDLSNFIALLKTKYKVEGEVKTKKIYETKINLIFELIDFLHGHEIPIFIELMDKKFYLSTQIVTHFITRPTETSDETSEFMNSLANALPHFLSDEIYHQFISTCKEYTASAFETFVEALLVHLKNTPEILPIIQMIKTEYLGDKDEEGEIAFKHYLPHPDPNHKGRMIHLLPNYHALSHVIARLQKFRKDHSLGKVDIIHDEQAHFEHIYKHIIETMKRVDTDEQITSEKMRAQASFNIDEHITLAFASSSSNPLIQVTDMIAGFIARTWNEFIEEEYDRLHPTIYSLQKLVTDVRPVPVGTNFFVPDVDFDRFMYLLHSYKT